MPSLPSYGVGPRVIVLYSEFISSGGSFIGHCSHSSNLIIDLVPVLNKIILIP